MRIVPVPCLEDNYAYLVISDAGHAAVVDASEASPIREALRREGATPRAIWSTHHHWDHVGANRELSAEWGVDVFGHSSDRERLPGISRPVEDGEAFAFDELEVRCMHVPGHTTGAVAYFVEGGSAVFTGDTLFCAGCGRLFEGTAAQMLASLTRLAQLPADTRVYCGHEYTESNLKFAAAIEPANAGVGRARDRARELRQRGLPTIGTTMGEELGVNPFLRSASAEVRRAVGVAPDADPVAAFAAVRAAKDTFRG